MEGYHLYKVCIDACLTTAGLCNHCAASCLKEEDTKMMAACIQLDMECATLCYATAKLMSLNSERVKDIARLCASICDACAEECNKHSNEHCRECAEACSKCADECETVFM